MKHRRIYITMQKCMTLQWNECTKIKHNTGHILDIHNKHFKNYSFIKLVIKTIQNKNKIK